MNKTIFTVDDLCIITALGISMDTYEMFLKNCGLNSLESYKSYLRTVAKMFRTNVHLIFRAKLSQLLGWSNCLDNKIKSGSKGIQNIKKLRSALRAFLKCVLNEFGIPTEKMRWKQVIIELEDVLHYEAVY